jgi:hypothetical protein
LSHPIYSTRLGRVGALLAAGCAFAAAPAVADAAPVNLATALPFSVLGGSAVTNTGPSVLNGNLGVSPGTSLTGFQFATVNGATHNNDAVAAQAQSDLTTAYNVAAGAPVTADLSGSDLGNRILQAGVYNYSSNAQLTGVLTLDGANDPNAQFIIQVGTDLTTASASGVVLTRGASACNVFWQIGSSATLGSTTAFQGNLMADQQIALNNGATVQGRLLARIAAVTLNNNVITAPACATPPPVTPTDGSGGAGGAGGSGGTAGTPVVTPPPASETTVPTRNGTITWKRETPRGSGGQPACTAGFRATLRGRQIKKVVYRLDGRVVKGTTKSPFRLFVRGLPGQHKVTARVTFKDATRAKTVTLAYRACAAIALRPKFGPSRFTG